MRLLALDADNSLHVISIADIYYDADEGELTITTISGEEYSVCDIDRYNAEDLIKTLYAEGKAELSAHYWIM